jgi:hypothetical protein
MKRSIVTCVGLLVVTTLNGCTAARMNETAQKLDASREALRTCLAANQSAPDACAAEKEMFEADLATYEARSSAISGARARGFAQGSAQTYNPASEPGWMQMRDQQQNLQQQMRDQQQTLHQQMRDQQQNMQQQMRDQQPVQVEIVP